MLFDTFEDFYRHSQRFGWSRARAQAHWRIYRGIRHRFIPAEALEDDVELEEFNREDYEDIPEVEETDLNPLLEDIGLEGETFSELTPLLGGGSGASTSLPGAVVGGLATLVGGAAVAGVVRAITTDYDSDDDDSDLDEEEEPKRPTITLPDHNYLGPGNDALSGLSIHDLDDQIAKEHDRKYENAYDEDYINDADEEAIHDFISDAIDTGNPHSIVAAIVLGIKKAVEQKTGVLYPAIKGISLFQNGVPLA